MVELIHCTFKTPKKKIDIISAARHCCCDDEMLSNNIGSCRHQKSIAYKF